MDTKKINQNIESNSDHLVKLEINRLVKLAKEKNVPLFIAWLNQDHEYVYESIIPEELNNLDSEYGKFMDFIQVVMKMNKDAMYPIITKPEEFK